MITDTTAKVGDTVTFNLWVKPYKQLTGKIVGVEKDRRKQAKYIIKPDEKVKEIPHETTYRFHPFTKLKTDSRGNPSLDENGNKQYEHLNGIESEDVTDIIYN